jgi:hypothetical protein
MWAAGEIGRVEWAAARDALDKRLEAAKGCVVAQQAPVALSGLPADAESLRGHWGTLTFDRRRAIIRAVVKAVTIGPGRRGYNKFDRNRVAITWKV